MPTHIITIDGPSGSGKGTLAAKIAAHYHYHLLDSGAIYRLLGLALYRKGLLSVLDDPEQLQKCVTIATGLDIEFKSMGHAIQVWLDGENVSTDIRTETVGEYASKVAAIPELRTALFKRQRAFAQAPGLVADGRDMATNVFPEAQAKIFLTASAESRAERRVKQLQAFGENVNMSDILVNIQARDLRDTQRAVAPLKPAVDAYLIDSSNMNIDEVFQLMLDYINQQLTKA